MAAGSVGYWEKEWQGQRVWETGWHVLPGFRDRHRHAGNGHRRGAGAGDGPASFHARFPIDHNAASNVVCRKLGFTLQGEVDFEFPPGHWMRCNDWRLDLGSASP